VRDNHPDNPPPDLNALINIGLIVRSRGLDGQVKILPQTDLIEQFSRLKQVYVRSGEEIELLTIASVQFIRQTPYIRFNGVDTVEAAERLRGAEILIHRSQRKSLPPEAYYLDEIQNFLVVSTTGEALGSLKDIEHLPASDLLVVEVRSGGEILIPFVEQWVLEIDHRNKTIVIAHEPSLWDEDNKPI